MIKLFIVLVINAVCLRIYSKFSIYEHFTYELSMIQQNFKAYNKEILGTVKGVEGHTHLLLDDLIGCSRRGQGLQDVQY